MTPDELTGATTSWTEQTKPQQRSDFRAFRRTQSDYPVTESS
jgi:hypothetical protein